MAIFKHQLASQEEAYTHQQSISTSHKIFSTPLGRKFWVKIFFVQTNCTVRLIIHTRTEKRSSVPMPKGGGQAARVCGTAYTITEEIE